MAHPSSVALNFVSRLAAEHVKVVLTGEGSDETLAGYNRYRVTLANLALGHAYERVVHPAMRRHLAAQIGRAAGQSVSARRLSRTFLALPSNLDALYFDNFAVFPRQMQSALLAPGLRECALTQDPYADAHRALARYPGATLLDRLLYTDVKTYLHELLMKQDQMSMAASIESRVPFLDHPLAEFAARLPSALKLHGFTTKVVLRRAMTGILPAEILSRRKMGFPVPVGSWLRGPWRHLLDDVVLSERALRRGIFDPAAVRQLVAGHTAGAPGHAERVWALLNFEVWQRIFFDGEEPGDVLASGGRALAETRH
jgi:asparagine synthase (glutamine-hydrolysing)